MHSYGSTNMKQVNNCNPLEIVKVNILRVLIEETCGSKAISKVRELSKELIIPESWEKNPDEFFLEGLNELQKEGLIHVQDDKITITEDGMILAEKILNYHKVIEDYFKRDFNEDDAHKIAHILEHYISKEVVENMKMISELEGFGVPLSEFSSSEGIITRLSFDEPQLFERIISMGVCPGQRITIIARVGIGLIVKLRNTQLAIDYKISKGIMVAMQ